MVHAESRSLAFRPALGVVRTKVSPSIEGTAYNMAMDFGGENFSVVLDTGYAESV